MASEKFALDVYVLHTPALASRKKLCEELREKLESATQFSPLTFTYIESYDVKDIDAKVIEKYVNLTKSTPATAFDTLVKGIHVRELSNALKHSEALQKVYEKTKVNPDVYSLVLEDDVVFSDNVILRLTNTMKALYEKVKAEGPDAWHLNFLGLPQPINVEKDEKDAEAVKVSAVESIFKILPEISSYFVSPAGASKLAPLFLPVRFATNIHFSYLSTEKALTAYNSPMRYTMSTPNVFVDGSKFGVYLSHIKPNNKLILNNEYTKLYNRIHAADFHKDNKALTLAEINAIRETFENMKFNTHPEIQTLKAVFESKMGEHEKALKIFENCYQIYVANDCLLTGESEFLLHYARLYKHFQST